MSHLTLETTPKTPGATESNVGIPLITPAHLRDGKEFYEVAGSLTMNGDMAITGAQYVDDSVRGHVHKLITQIVTGGWSPREIPVYRMLTPFPGGGRIVPEFTKPIVVPTTNAAVRNTRIYDSDSVSVQFQLSRDPSFGPYADDGVIGLIVNPQHTVVWVRNFLPSQKVDVMAQAARDEEWKRMRAHWLNLGIHTRGEVDYFDQAIDLGNTFDPALQLGLATGKYNPSVEYRQRLMIATFLNQLAQRKFV